MSKQEKMSKPAKSKGLCVGCRENFYNGYNDIGTKECWNYKSARVVKRYRIGWWTPQDRAENFDPVMVMSCRCDTGRFAYYDKLPGHLR